MIYITGDCHGSFRRFTRKQRDRLPFKLTADDYIIVTGDFGLLWAKDAELEYNLEWLSGLPFKILWVQGNHENYDMIAEYPLEQWNGGSVRHIVRDKIILLERGQVFSIDGNTFFTFGGASSHDVSGGILDKDDIDYDEQRRKAIKSGMPYRVKHYSWWEQELPTEAEMQVGRDSLEKVGYSVDYVISHCLSTSMQYKLGLVYGGNSHRFLYKPDILTGYFDEIESKLQYKQWMCGHYHMDMSLDNRHKIFYKSILSLEDVATW